MSRLFCCAQRFCLALLVAPAAFAGLVATYTFNNTLAAQESGVAPLVAVDPLGTSGYQPATVFGNSQTTWHFDGANIPVTSQGGLQFNTTGLISPNSYSVEMVFELTGGSGWRRLLDSLDRTSDNGLYISPSHDLEVFPQGGNSSPFSPNTFFDIVVTVDTSNTVTGYFGGNQQFSLTSTNMIVAGHTLGFFLDNTAGGGQGEWSSGNIALVKVWDTALTPRQVAAEHDNPFQGTETPEPSAWALGLSGVAAFLFRARRK